MKTKMNIKVQHRTEDFQKVDALHYLADNSGLRVLSFANDAGGWCVTYLNTALAIEPKQEYCRDALDYDLRIGAWIKACSVPSKKYPSFQDMVLGEIERLKAKL